MRAYILLINPIFFIIICSLTSHICDTFVCANTVSSVIFRDFGYGALFAAAAPVAALGAVGPASEHDKEHSAV